MHERTHAHARAQVGGAYYPFIPSTNEGFSCTSSCVGRRAYHCQAVMWRIHDQQIESTHSYHSSTSTMGWYRCRAVRCAPPFTGEFERVMNHAEAIEEVAEQALEAGQRWKHLAEARAQTTLQDLEHSMRTTLDTDAARHRSEFDLAVGIRRSVSNTHTVHRPTTFVPSCSNFFSVKSCSNEVLSTWRESSFVIGFSEEELRVILHIFLTYFAVHQQFILRAYTHTTKQS